MLVHKTREIKSIKKTLNNSTMQSSNYNVCLLTHNTC